MCMCLKLGYLYTIVYIYTFGVGGYQYNSTITYEVSQMYEKVWKCCTVYTVTPPSIIKILSGKENFTVYWKQENDIDQVYLLLIHYMYNVHWRIIHKYKLDISFMKIFMPLYQSLKIQSLRDYWGCFRDESLNFFLSLFALFNKNK